MTRYLLLLIGLVPATGVLAQTQELSLFGTPFSFELPSGWKLAASENRADMVSAEFVPAQENLNQWGGLICVQSFKLSDDSPAAEAFLDGLARQYQGSCEGDVSYEKLGEVDTDGYPGFHAILGCSRMPNQHASMEESRPFFSKPEAEVGYYRVVSRPGQLVLMHKSTRGDVYAGQNIPLTPANHGEFIASVLPLRLD
ncbi:hypothetical protein [Shewanella zhangzhouensis]|uniref:hypothetical protein n=1 Tax=Shewanella zhangzhouensis TaxID=2864213 RepID=UPI001C65C17A|nr:hypothetical protein [Shewanella zhangzhouensis]QYK04293.1 hypothetical protein K0H63_14635 [Shewanella zhangzhouensis]